MPTTRCGVIAIAGRPNAGKSTLLNALVGAPLAIVSGRPQSTRLPVVGMRTDEDVQLIFVDSPGLLDPTYPLQAAMLQEAITTLQRADAVLYVHALDAPEHPAPPLEHLLPSHPEVLPPVCTVYTKLDLAPSTTGQRVAGRIAVSALTGHGLEPLLAWCRAQVPEGGFRYEADDLSTQPTRFFVAEFVREAVFALLGQELPYAIATEVDEFREGADPLYIRVTLFVERDSQKGMVVGRAGRMIRELGARARQRIETFLDARVYLDLWVKTLPNWRSNPGALRRFGFSMPPERPYERS